MVPKDGVRAGVHVAGEVVGGGVGLFNRPPVSERKAVKSAWVEERRSGVRGTWSDGGDMRPGVAGRKMALEQYKDAESTCVWAKAKIYEGGASASSLP